jgi:hypothetical protein
MEPLFVFYKAPVSSSSVEENNLGTNIDLFASPFENLISIVAKEKEVLLYFREGNTFSGASSNYAVVSLKCPQGQEALTVYSLWAYINKKEFPNNLIDFNNVNKTFPIERITDINYIKRFTDEKFPCSGGSSLGMDGSNSGRWKLSTATPVATEFSPDSTNPASISSIDIHISGLNGNYSTWLSLLDTFSTTAVSFLQIYEVGNFSVFGVYAVTGMSFDAIGNYWTVSVSLISSNGVFTPNGNYSISWITNGEQGPQGIPGQDGTGTAYYGEVSKITSGVINVITAGTYQSTGLTATLDPENFGVSLGTTDSFAIKNTSGETVLYKIYASADIEAGNNKVLGIKLALNGVPIDETECNAPTGTGTSFAKLVTNWMIELAPDDEVALYVTNFTSTGNITFQRGRIVASTVGRQGNTGPAGTITQVTPITILDTGWTLVSGLWEYDISDSNILANSIVDIIPANADYTTVIAAQLLPESISSVGQVKIFAVNQPTADFDITLNIFD